VRAQERAPDYRVAAAWGALLLFIGAGAWCLGMAIHNEALAAKQHAQRPRADLLLRDGRRDADVRALQGNEGSEGYLMTVSNQILLVVDAGTPVAAFTARQELKAYLRRRLDSFINPLVYTFWDNRGTPSIMTMSSALGE
jgi:hypothetical protein